MAVNSVTDFIEAFDFNQIHKIFLDGHYYTIFFPFLLFYAILITVLGIMPIFQYKETKKPITPIITIISLVVALFGVTYDLPSGYSVGDLMMMLFPNISAITMGVLCLYIIGGMLGKDFFDGVFDKNFSSYAFLAVGAIGLGATVYYTGIVLGFWDFDPFDQTSYWSVVLAIAALITGIVLVAIEKYAFGFLLLIIFGSYMWGGGDVSMIDILIDPVVFIFFIFTMMITWMKSPKERKAEVERNLTRQERRLSTDYSDPKMRTRVKDMLETNFDSNKKEYKELTGQDWKKS